MNKFHYYVCRFFADAHVLPTTVKVACSLDQIQSNYSFKLMQLDFENGIRTAWQAQIDCRDETEIN